MILGQQYQVPFRAVLCSPLRAFVGSSDKLVRGAGWKLPPNRLSQKGEQNENETSSPGQLCGKEGGGMGPAFPALNDPLIGAPSPRHLRNQSPGLKNTEAHT